MNFYSNNFTDYVNNLPGRLNRLDCARLATTQPSESSRIASKVKVFSHDCLTTTWVMPTIIQILELNKLPSILQQRGWNNCLLLISNIVCRYLCFRDKFSSRFASLPHVFFLFLHLNHSFSGRSVLQGKLAYNLAKLVDLAKTRLT